MISLMKEISGFRIKVIDGAGVRTSNVRRSDIPASHDIDAPIFFIESNFFTHISSIILYLLNK